MFDRFDDRSRKAMGLAHLEALRLNHDYIGTEHVLLGIVEEGGGVAAGVLKDLGLDLGKVRSEVERRVTPGTRVVAPERLPFTPRVKKVLELSLEESSHLGHTHIGTEHLLLGLIREEGGVAAQALRGLGVRVEDVRAKVAARAAVGRPEPGAALPPDRGTLSPPRPRNDAGPYGAATARAIGLAALAALGEKGEVTPARLMHGAVVVATEYGEGKVEAPACLDADGLRRHMGRRWTGPSSSFLPAWSPFSAASLVVLGDAFLLAGNRGDRQVGLADLLDALVKDGSVPDEIPPVLGSLRVADVRAWAERLRARGG